MAWGHGGKKKAETVERTSWQLKTHRLISRFCWKSAKISSSHSTPLKIFPVPFFKKSLNKQSHTFISLDQILKSYFWKPTKVWFKLLLLRDEYFCFFATSFKGSLEISLLFVNLTEIITAGAKPYLGLHIIFYPANNLQQLRSNHLSMAVFAVLSWVENNCSLKYQRKEGKKMGYYSPRREQGQLQERIL